MPFSLLPWVNLYTVEAKNWRKSDKAFIFREFSRKSCKNYLKFSHTDKSSSYCMYTHTLYIIYRFDNVKVSSRCLPQTPFLLFQPSAFYTTIWVIQIQIAENKYLASFSYKLTITRQNDTHTEWPFWSQ